MKISRKKHRYIRLQNILFTVLFVGCLGLLAWLSTQYTHQSDWTANNRNSLSAQSIQLLGKLKKPIEITAYASEIDILRQQITELTAKYIQHKTDISLEIINPDTRPDRAREEGITTDGELILRYNGKRESLQQLNEQALTNALQRLTNSEQQWVVFLSGHGERNPSGHANFDYGLFANELKKKGINSQTINLIDSPSIPINTSLLIIADPQTTLLKGEVSLIKDYLAKGRPLLLLGEPNHSNIIKPLTEWLGIELLPGTVVDATTQLFGIDDPTFALVTEYPHHLATQHLQATSLFPGTTGLAINPDGPYTTHPLLSTLERSWTETGSIEGHIQFDPHTDEKQGPITIGYALSKNDSSGKEQRLAVLGDADFISNSFLGNGANLDLGLSLIQWLNHNDTLIEIPAKTALDTTLDINETWSLIFGLGFLFVLPAVFILCGLVIWLKRKKR